MALTFSFTSTAMPNFRMPPLKGSWKIGFVDITLDASYVQGGYTITAANLGLPNGIANLFPPPFKVGTGANLGNGYEWDQVAGKLRIWKTGVASSPFAEIAASDATISGIVIRCMYIGW